MNAGNESSCEEMGKKHIKFSVSLKIEQRCFIMKKSWKGSSCKGIKLRGYNNEKQKVS